MPVTGIGAQRERGVPAVPHHHQGPTHRDPRARPTGSSPALVDSWSATDTQAGVAFSIDPTRVLNEVANGPPGGRHAGRLPALGHRGHLVRLGRATGRSRPRCSRPAPTSSSGATPTAVFGAGKVGPALVAYGLGNFVYWREDGESGRSGVLKVTATAVRSTATSGSRRGSPTGCRSPRPAAPRPPTSPSGTPAERAAACRPDP